MNKKPRLITTLCLLLCTIATSSRAEIQTSGPIHNDGCIWPVLKIGMRASNVKALQYVLYSKGYKIVTDGNFGLQTQNFVKQFQRAHKLHATGVVEAYTWEALVPLLHRGSHSDAVRAVQILLNWQFANWDLPPGKKRPGQIRVDGDYGTVTE